MIEYPLSAPASSEKSDRQKTVALPVLPLTSDPAAALLDRLPKIESAALAALNLILGRHGRTTLEWPDGSECSLNSFSGFTHRLPADQTAELVIEARLGPHRIYIGLTSTAFLQILDGPNAALLPPEIKCALLESYLGEAIRKFEQSVGIIISVTGLTHSPKKLPDRGYNLFFDLRRDADRSSTSGYLSMDRQGLDCLADLLKDQSSPLDWERIDHLHVPVGFVLGTTRLRPPEFSHLAGDVIVLIDDVLTAGSQELPLRVDLAGSPFWQAKKAANHIVIEKRWEHAMEVSTKHTGQEPEVIEDLENIELELVFELGRRSMSLAEVRRIGPGHTFDLAGDLREPVSIYLNRDCIGKGELVNIDNRLGVRLIQYLQRQ